MIHCGKRGSSGMHDITILHTADLHIGRILHGKSLLEDQRHILGEIVGLAEARQPDAIVIGGDLFDRSVPSAEAVRLADWFFQECAGRLGIPTIVIAGNHDSPERLEFAAGLLSRLGLHILGSFDAELQPIILGSQEYPVELYPIPYAEPGRIHLAFNNLHDEEEDGEAGNHQEAWERIMAVLSERWAHATQCPRILVAHLFAAGGQASDSERPLSLGGAELVAAETFQPFDLVLLGHLHRPQQVSQSVWYSGSPLCYGLAEIDQIKSLLWVGIDPSGKHPCRVEPLPLSPLRPVRLLRASLAELLQQSSDDYVYIRLTDHIPIHDAFFRLQAVFPALLQVEREIPEHTISNTDGERRKDALASGDLALINAFLQDMTGNEIPSDWLGTIHEVLSEQLQEFKDGEE